MGQANNSSHHALFYRMVIRRPLQLGAVAPSSPELARAMAQWVPTGDGVFVLELGPGTGAVTEALLERGLPPPHLVAIEKSPEMATHLRQRFPGAIIITGDATHTRSLVASAAPQAASFALVICGIPLMNFPLQTTRHIASEIRQVLQPGGKLIQFSYHIWKKRSSTFADLQYCTSRVVWSNFPPARVTVYQK